LLVAALFASAMHATPLVPPIADVLVANPDGTPDVAIGNVSVPGAMFFA
jgi:hypothetical protein